MVHDRLIEFLGAPGSPYTRKLIAALRYRRIPYAVFWGRNAVPESYPEPAVRLLPTVYFKDSEANTVTPMTDSSPILRRLERDYPGRTAIPANPVLAFLNDLIEDYADEWLTKAMFHYRWAFEDDSKNAAPLLVYWNDQTIDPEAANQWADQFARRQIDRLYVVGSNDITAETIEQSFQRMVSILHELIARKGFVLGRRPSTADFAIHGQLTQLAVIEPTSARITRSLSQRVRAWVDLTEDLSGLRPMDDDWFDLDDARTALSPLIGEIGRTYAPAMAANALAIAAGEESFETLIDGRPWKQPVFRYQAKCLGWLRQSYSALSDRDRADVDDLLSGSGCEQLFG